MIQGSAEWFAAKLGKVTASRVAAVLSKGRNGGIPVTRNSYMDDLIAERLLGVTVGQNFSNGPTAWGGECEAEARTFYALTRGVDVETVGFIDHPKIPMSGASPDGLVGSEGFVEIKCPNTITHLETIRRGSVPSKHLPQINWQAACMPERKWCDFTSYDPRVEDRAKRLFVKRIEIDRAEVARIEGEVCKFLAELEPLAERVRAYLRRAA